MQALRSMLGRLVFSLVTTAFRCFSDKRALILGSFEESVPDDKQYCMNTTFAFTATERRGTHGDGTLKEC